MHKLQEHRLALDAELADVMRDFEVGEPFEAKLDELLMMSNAIRDELPQADLDFLARSRIIELLDVRVTVRVVDGRRALAVVSSFQGDRMWVELQRL